MTTAASAPQTTAVTKPVAALARDHDIDPGFPVKRFVLMLIYANMIFIGGAFVAIMALGIYSLVQFSFFSGYLGGGTTVHEFFRYFHQAMEQMWDFVADDPAQTARFLILASIPGTIGGLAWYLILRWRESVILRKRRLAGHAKAPHPPIGLA
jgi:hypothetical protein